MASLGTPRILVGFSSLSTFGVGMAVEEHRAGTGRATTFCPLSPTLMFGAPVTSVLGSAVAVVDGRQLELVGVGMLARRRSDLGDDDLVAVPDRAGVLGLDADALGDRQAEDAHAGDFQAGQRQPLDELRRRAG